jgi:hypothetical protein
MLLILQGSRENTILYLLQSLITIYFDEHFFISLQRTSVLHTFVAMFMKRKGEGLGVTVCAFETAPF